MDRQLEKEDYETNETLTLKVPISLPYPIHSSEYQHLKGTFEHEGEFFNLIKQKLKGDTLYVVCIKNVQKSTLELKKIDFEKAFNNWSATTHKTYQLLNTFIKDYLAGQKIMFNQQDSLPITISFDQIPYPILTRNNTPPTPPPKSAI